MVKDRKCLYRGNSQVWRLGETWSVGAKRGKVSKLRPSLEAGLEKEGSEGEGWWEEASSCFQKEGSSCGECGEVSIILKLTAQIDIIQM